MQFKQGTHVYTSDSREVGTVDRVVLDPTTDEVSGLVVRKGWLLTADKVVPIGLVENATEDRIVLRQTQDDLQKLPEYEESYYIPAEREHAAGGTPLPAAHTSYAPPLYGYPPVGTAWWGYGSYLDYPTMPTEPEYIQHVEKHIPEGTIALKEGARVLNRDGKHVGDVEDVFTDAATNRVTHLLISKGVFFKDHKLVPSNWVKVTGDDEVTLTVSTDVLNHLPEYAPV